MTAKSKKTLRKPPKQKRSKALVDAISEAATRILKKAGYSKTTTNWVAETAGVSVGSLYQYFPNKESIVSFLIDQSIARLSTKAKEKLASLESENYESANRAFITYAVGLFYDYRDELRAIHKTAPMIEHFEYLQRVRDEFSKLLAEHMRRYENELPTQDFERSAFFLHHAIMGVIETYVLDQSKDIPREVMIDELSHLALSYVKSPKL